VPVSAAPAPRQATFDELGRPLREVTFVVVDLETTGTGPDVAEITEIGAVKVRGGEVLGEFATLVRPAAAIPPFVAVLTGITDLMVASAPPISAALPAFLEFSRGAVLVAHNAPFDLGFLRAACERGGFAVPSWEHLDTARIARRVLTRDEAPDCKLSTLARLFRSPTEPCHRALADARATVVVLHSLLERVGGLGVHTLEELRDFSVRVSEQQRRKRHLADGLPTGAGVYVFRDAAGRPLYVGTSASVRARVRTYFTSSEQRGRMAEMIAIADRVDAIACAHTLEAQVRELRLIAEHKPPYNRRSRFPERASYLKLTVEPFPRLSTVRAVRNDGATYLGPFGAARSAELAAAALHDALPLRRCGGRLPSQPAGTACALADLGRCGAPCDGRESEQQYARHVAAADRAIRADPARVVDATRLRIARLVTEQRFEEAAAARDRIAAFLRASARLQRLSAITRWAELTAAAPTPAGGWDLAVVRWGRLAAASSVPPGIDPRPWVDAARASAETVRPGPGPTPAASAEETECVLRWLDGPGTRLVTLSEPNGRPLPVASRADGGTVGGSAVGDSAVDGGAGGWCSPSSGAARELWAHGWAPRTSAVR
jgi:DNA polymerase-3 subunit epsilon